MGWKKAWFGSEDPSRGDVGKVVAAFAVLGLVLLGLFVDFVPAPFLYGRQWLLPMLLLGVAFTAWLFVHARRHGRMSHLAGKGVLHLLLVIVVMPPLLGFLCWLMLAKSLPWAFTCAFGTPFLEAHVMQAHYEHHRRSCDYRLRGGPMEHGFPAYLCIGESFYRRHPEQQVSVMLTGKRSALGTRIEQVHSRP